MKPTTLETIDQNGKSRFTVVNVEDGCPKHWPSRLVQSSQEGFDGHTVCLICGRLYEKIDGSFQPTDRFITNRMYPTLRALRQSRDTSRHTAFAAH